MITQKDEKINEMYARLKAIRQYARKVKYVAEGLVPEGKTVPEELIHQPPFDLDDEQVDATQGVKDPRASFEYAQELQQYRDQIRKLERQLADA